MMSDEQHGGPMRTVLAQFSDGLRLDDVLSDLLARGWSRSEALASIVAAVRRARLQRSEIGSGPLIQFPTRPRIPASRIAYDREWVVLAEVDVDASTIMAPVRRRPMGEDALEPVILEMERESFARIWPEKMQAAPVNVPAQSRRGRPRLHPEDDEIVRRVIARVDAGEEPSVYAAALAEAAARKEHKPESFERRIRNRVKKVRPDLLPSD